MLKKILFFVCLFAIVDVYSQTTINGTLLNTGVLALDNIKLYSYSGGDIKLVDSAKVINNKFTIKRKEFFSNGAYKLTISGFQYVDYIFTSKESSVDIVIDIKNLKDSTNLCFNDENAAFYKFQSVFNSQKVNLMFVSKTRSNLMKLQTFQEADLMNLKNSVSQLNGFVKNEIDKIKSKYPNTYTSKVLINMLLEPDISNITLDKNYLTKEHELQINNFFNSWDLKNPEVFNNPYVFERLQTFFSKVCYQTEKGYKAGIDALMMKVNTANNEIVRDNVIIYLIRNFNRFGPIEVVLYIMDNHLEGCSTLPVVQENKERIEKMRNMAMGQKYTDVLGSDISGKEVKLSDYVGKKNVLLLFWSSGCPHCMQEIPKIKSVYEQFKDKNLEVFSFSLDTDKNKWQKALNQLNTGWINVCDFKGFASVNVSNYFVYQTPVGVLINKDGIMIAKNKWGDDLIKVLNENVK
ncbi:MAG: TlpA disulfide reductase family protein [Bacteroidota bacterium]